MGVAITWSVTGVSTLIFQLQDCTVKHGKSNIINVLKIVKNGCYAGKLNVVPVSNKYNKWSQCSTEKRILVYLYTKFYKKFFTLNLYVCSSLNFIYSYI